MAISQAESKIYSIAEQTNGLTLESLKDFRNTESSILCNEAESHKLSTMLQLKLLIEVQNR